MKAAEPFIIEKSQSKYVMDNNNKKHQNIIEDNG